MAKKTARATRRTVKAANRSRPSVEELLHELNVFGEEITLQNEQLVAAQSEIEAARDRYAELYDFAPVGYVTFDTYGKILEINLTGAEMLGRNRVGLIGMSMLSAVESPDRDTLRAFLMAATPSRKQATPRPMADVRIRRTNLTVRLMAKAMISPLGPPRIFAAMLNMTEQDRLNRERDAALAEAQERSHQLSVEVLDRERAERLVKGLLERMVTVQEEERRRLARNLHDHLGQQLTALRLSIGALKEVRRVSVAAVRERIDALDRMVAQLDKDVDMLAWDLRPPALDGVGLSGALDDLVRQWSAATGIATEFHTSSARAVRPPQEVESHVYRIVQEALNNVSKHAAASSVSVVLGVRNDQLILTVEDDGRGYCPDGDAPLTSHGGMGIAGMKERAALAGGDIAFESSPGKGTMVLVRIPLKL